MKKRVIGGICLALAMLFSVAGCQSEKKEKEEDKTPDAAQMESLIPKGEESDKLLEFRKNGIRVGTCNDIPYEYVDDNGSLAGFEIEIIREACKRLGITKLVPVVTSWDVYSTELQQNKFDIFSSGVYVTEERLKVMNFCNKTYNLKECVVVRKDSGIKSMEDLKDKTVASIAGMLYMDITKEAVEKGIFGKAAEGGQPSALALDVQTKKVDAAVMDVVMGAYVSSLDNMSDLEVLKDYEAMSADQCSYLLNIETTDFVKEFNIALDSMKEDGTMKEILDDYGLGDNVIGVEEGKVELPARK